MAGKKKINSKDKGARFERELANLLKEYGYDCRRTAQYCGNTGDAADVIGLPGIHIEAKHCEAMRLYDWMEQAKRDSAGSDKVPAVFHKKNRAAILVTMELDDWIKIYKDGSKNAETTKIEETKESEECQTDDRCYSNRRQYGSTDQEVEG